MTFINKCLSTFITYAALGISGLRSSLFQKFCVLMLFAFLAACGGLPSKPGGKSEKAVEKSSESSADAGEVLEPLELIPNPYLKNKKSVPAKAKQEFARGHAAMKAKKYQQAVGIWTLMTETYPKLAGPYVNLGIANWRLGNNTEAENAFKFAIETNRYNMDAYAQLGILYREQGKFIDAEQTYLQALQVWPHHLDSIINLGVLYDLYMGRLSDALPYYRLSQRVAPEPSKQMKGWIVDLERRIAAAAR